MVTCRLPGKYCIKLYMYVNELWNAGSGEGYLGSFQEYHNDPTSQVNSHKG